MSDLVNRAGRHHRQYVELVGWHVRVTVNFHLDRSLREVALRHIFDCFQKLCGLADGPSVRVRFRRRVGCRDVPVMKPGRPGIRRRLDAVLAAWRRANGSRALVRARREADGARRRSKVSGMGEGHEALQDAPPRGVHEPGQGLRVDGGAHAIRQPAPADGRAARSCRRVDSMPAPNDVVPAAAPPASAAQESFAADRRLRRR